MLTRKDVACPVNGPNVGKCRIKSTGGVIGRVEANGRWSWRTITSLGDGHGTYEYREGAIRALIDRWNELQEQARQIEVESLPEPNK